MKEKITQNDRMSIEQQSYEIAAAAFRALLKKRGLYQWYFQSWKQDHWITGNMPESIAWENWAIREDIVDWVSNAFIWNTSTVPSSIWRALDIEWIKWISDNK